MNITHLHLMLNHVPVIGILFAIGLLFFAMRRGSDELARASLAIFALLGLISIVVYFTGEPAEDVVHGLPGFSEVITERHEEMALPTTIAAAVLGVVGVLALIRARSKTLSRRMMRGVLLLAVGAEGLMGYTAYLGGQVRHTEVRAPSGGEADR
jgi:hypothetical protein